MLGAVEEAAREAGVACNALHRASDSPWEEIIKVATEQGCDLISWPRTDARRHALLLGSETTKVLTHWKIPVHVFERTASQGAAAMLRLTGARPGSSRARTSRRAVREHRAGTPMRAERRWMGSLARGLVLAVSPCRWRDAACCPATPCRPS